MKRSLVILFMLVLCFFVTACEETTNKEVKSTQAATEETQPITYTYEVQPMQNAHCIYYGPNDIVPNSPDPKKLQGKISARSQCPNCGEDYINGYIIDPAELDFSSSDTIMYSDTSSCWDCSWNKNIDQFMWTIRITRIPE